MKTGTNTISSIMNTAPAMMPEQIAFACECKAKPFIWTESARDILQKVPR